MTKLMNGEAEFTAGAVEILRADPRGAAVVTHAKKNKSLPEQLGSTGAASDNVIADLFELRVAAALSRLTKAKWEYEHATGVENSSVDFYVPGPPDWLLEVVSIRTSQNVQRATSHHTDALGIEHWATLLTSSFPAGQGKFESEMLLAQSKILAKVSRDGRPWKFPPPSGASFHAVVVDARGYLGDGGGDLWDWIQMTAGVRFLRRESPYQSLDGRPIVGIFEEDHPMSGADLAQQRLHFVIFVEETAFDCGEVRYKSCCVNNPTLLPSEAEIVAAFPSYPLRGCHELRPLCLSR